MAWADLAGLANVAARNTFGVAVTYTPAGGAAQSIVAPFDDAHVELTIEGGVPATTTRPVVDVVLADLSAEPLIGDAVSIAGVSYVVTDVQPGGHGTAKCFLRLSA